MSAAPRAERSTLLGYLPPDGGRDECCDPDGLPRAPWSELGARIAALPRAEIERRLEHARRELREGGSAEGGDGAAAPARGDLDPVPLVIGDTEWDALASAVRQRARVIDAVLSDLHGPQRLLRDGLLAPAAVLPHPSFLRPCHGMRPLGGWLRHYAVDLVRAIDGRWLCASDRSQAPSGDGLALETRLALKRVLPEAYRDLHVRRLAPYFVALRESLTAVAPRGGDNPRIVLLTPGPYSPAHGEHSFLARYLGYPLVEGGDLVVRDDAVQLKTLGGLHPVDAILRRQHDAFCDPLELRNDSTLGIPGLTQAARAGRVALLNPLGSGLGENRALLPALPRLCRALLGEELALPSVPSWWCGDALAEVESRLDDVALLSAMPGLRPDRFVPRELPRAARAELLAQVRARPHAWIAQELVRTATVPAWECGALRARSFAVRAFAIADRDGFAVMSGGRCTLPAVEGLPAAEKDLWVLAKAPVEEVSLLPAKHLPVELRRGSIELPSRVADNLYWIGRYAERAECAARLARALAERLGENARTQAGRELAQLVAMARAAGMSADPEADAATTLRAMVAGTSDGGGIRGNLGRMRRAVLAVRDRISNDTARIIARLEREDLGAAVEARAFDGLVTALAALAGMCHENTTRGPGWRFLDAGRRVERALLTADLLRAALAGEGAATHAAMTAVLEVADSAITYRSRYLASLQPHAVLDLLLTDDSNPRSLLFQLEALAGHLAGLPREQALPTQAERLALGARTWLRLVDPLELCRVDERGARPALGNLLEHLASDMALLSDALVAQWLEHAAPPHALRVGGG